MRKKQHKCINPTNKDYDKFYIINYLVSIWDSQVHEQRFLEKDFKALWILKEPGKLWQDLKHEKDVDESDLNENGLK